MLHVRTDFPIFEANPGLVYLDSAATAQKPAVVIDAVADFYRTGYSSVHRGLYPLAAKSTADYEQVRETVKNFIEASSTTEIVFIKNATEAINAVASGLSKSWQPGDEIIVSELEHHANLVPWQEATRNTGVIIKYVQITEAGEIDLEHLKELVTDKTRVVALAHTSNVLGTIIDPSAVKKIITEQGSQALFLLDASQSVAHLPLHVSELGCDFLVFSGHKLYAPSGTGVLWGREALLNDLPPLLTGGDMIKTVTLEKATWNDLPWKFEAGTPNIEGIIGLGVAITYLQTIGMEQIREHTVELSNLLRSELSKLPDVKVIGNPAPESGLVSFTVEGIHPHDLSELLGKKQVCIRAGHHCAAPVHAILGLAASNRASVGIYNTEEDITKLLSALTEIINDFRRV